LTLAPAECFGIGTKAPQVSLSFTRVPNELGAKYDAIGGRYLTVHPRQALAPEEVEKRLIPAVRAAASAVGSICECDVMRG
jgi:hypothetical protein